MPDYIVTGRKGGGKTLAMVGRMRDYIESGRPVATNIDIDIRKLVRKRPTAPIYRLPDIPTAADLEAIGQVHATGREELNGGLFLDECAVLFNARAWNDKERAGLIGWFAHARKLGWDNYFLVQALGMLDKQMREAFGEYIVVCRRLDRVRIPFIGKLGHVLTLGLWSGNAPKVHVATVRYGAGPGSIHADTWWYRGHELYDAYDTTQRIGLSRCGVHVLHWYATKAEQAAWPKKPKPKHDLVQWIERLPAERRIPAMRRLGLC